MHFNPSSPAATARRQAGIPAHGRFVQPDPIGYGDGMNPYAYVGGDPVNRIDPTGLSQECRTYYENSYSYYDSNNNGIHDRGERPVSGSISSVPHNVCSFGPKDYSGGGGIGGGGAAGESKAGQGIVPIVCAPVTFRITGVGPNQANSDARTSLTRQPGRDIDPRGGGVAIKPQNFGVSDIEGRRDILSQIILIPMWDAAQAPPGAPAIPPGLPSRGLYRPIDLIGPRSVRNSPGNHIDLYRYSSQSQAFRSTRDVPVIAIIPPNREGVRCPR